MRAIESPSGVLFGQRFKLGWAMYLSRPICLCRDPRTVRRGRRMIGYVTLPLLGLLIAGLSSHAVEYKGGASTAELFATSYQHADAELLSSQQQTSRVDNL